MSSKNIFENFIGSSLWIVRLDPSTLMVTKSQSALVGQNSESPILLNSDSSALYFLSYSSNGESVWEFADSELALPIKCAIIGHVYNVPKSLVFIRDSLLHFHYSITSGSIGTIISKLNYITVDMSSGKIKWK